MGVFLLGVLCVVRKRFHRRADHQYRGVIPSVVCPKIVIVKSRKGGCDPELGQNATGERKAYQFICMFTCTVVSLNIF